MAKKSFFRERTVREIQRLNTSQAYSNKGLVEKINDLNPDLDNLQIRTQIIPGKFTRNSKTNVEASRKCLKHGDLIILSQPELQRDAYNLSEIPLQMRARDFSELENMREEEIYFVGYSFRPVQGRDKTKRIVPFVWCPEGLRLFAYAENIAPEVDGISVESYDDAERVKKEGASVVLEVPSRTKKKERYKIKLMHVPIKRSRENLATVLSLKPAVLIDEETGEPEIGRTPHSDYNIRYTYSTDVEGSEVITFYPQDIAGYVGVIKDQNKKHNLTPMEMNPFALFSKKGAEFYKKLCNNAVMFDPTLERKDQLRKLHLAEKSILLARAIGKYGHDDVAFWDPIRDRKLKDYNWRI